MDHQYVPANEVQPELWAKADGLWDITTAEGHHIKLPYDPGKLWGIGKDGPNKWAEGYTFFVSNGFTPAVAMDGAGKMNGVSFDQVVQASKDYNTTISGAHAPGRN
jgi:hypothetical protein